MSISGWGLLVSWWGAMAGVGIYGVVVQRPFDESLDIAGGVCILAFCLAVKGWL